MLKNYKFSLFGLLIVGILFTGIFLSSAKVTKADVYEKVLDYSSYNGAGFYKMVVVEPKKASTYKTPPVDTLQNLIKKVKEDMKKYRDGGFLVKFANGEIRSFPWTTNDGNKDLIEQYEAVFGKVTEANYVYVNPSSAYNRDFPSTYAAQALKQDEINLEFPITGYCVDNNQNVWKYTSSSGKNNPAINVTSQYPN